MNAPARVGVVGVVGAGTMGAGIAQVALEAGDEVALYDVAPGAVEGARARIAEGLGRRAAKLGLEGARAEAWVEARTARLRAVDTLAAVAAGADLVVEAAVEDLALKRVVFATLDAQAGPATILATNTSALPVAEIAADAADRSRIVGLHFFNPAPVMPLVEVVVGRETDPETADRAEALMVRWGKTPIRCANSPGFIVNRINRPFTLEALRMLEGGTATIEEIDGAIRAAGFPQGPFEHIDLIGLDVNLATSRAVHEGLGSPERLAPSPLQERLVAARRPGPQARRRLLRVRRRRPPGPPRSGLRTARRQARGAASVGHRGPHQAVARERGVPRDRRRGRVGRPDRRRPPHGGRAPAGPGRVGDGARSRPRRGGPARARSCGGSALRAGPGPRRGGHSSVTRAVSAGSRAPGQPDLVRA